MLDTIIGQVFVRRTITFIIIVGAIIGILFFIKYALKDDKHLKLILMIAISLAIIVTSILGHSLIGIYLDIRNKDYITYCGTFIERGGGQKDLKTIVVYDGSGKEVRLLRTGSSKEGTYEGTVTYGKHSKIVVEYSGSKIDLDT